MLDHSLQSYCILDSSTKPALMKAIASLQQFTDEANALYWHFCSLCFIYMCLQCEI